MTLKVFIDGILRGAATDRTKGPLENDSDVVIGNANNAAQQFFGDLSYVRVHLIE